MKFKVVDVISNQSVKVTTGVITGVMDFYVTKNGLISRPYYFIRWGLRWNHIRRALRHYKLKTYWVMSKFIVGSRVVSKTNTGRLTKDKLRDKKLKELLNV